MCARPGTQQLLRLIDEKRTYLPPMGPPGPVPVAAGPPGGWEPGAWLVLSDSDVMWPVTSS